jgi:YidC/Oxa1 family membrane protein insertase
MKSFFNTFFYDPMYNALVFLVGVLPGESVGLAVITLTILVKFILFPLAHKSTTTQARMRAIEPHIKKIKEKHKDDQQAQARATMELYKEHGVNPFSGCFLMLLQLPVIFALYFVFFDGMKFNQDILYSFILLPEHMNMVFFGTDLAAKSIPFAFIAAVTQYFQIKLSIPTPAKAAEGVKPSFQEEFSRSMAVQMKYVFPVLVFFIAYTISSAVALYWIVSNAFSICHELYVKRKAEGFTKT